MPNGMIMSMTIIFCFVYIAAGPPAQFVDDADYSNYAKTQYAQDEEAGERQ